MHERQLVFATHFPSQNHLSCSVFQWFGVTKNLKAKQILQNKGTVGSLDRNNFNFKKSTLKVIKIERERRESEREGGERERERNRKRKQAR